MTTRQGFLGAAGALGAVLAAGERAAAATPAPAASPKPDPSATLPPLQFDERAFSRLLNKDSRHRQCFGNTQIKDGEVLGSMSNSLNAYEFDLGEGPTSMRVIAVLYHSIGIAIGLDDNAWNELLIPAIPKLPAMLRSDVTGGAPKLGPKSGNPFLHRVKGQTLRDDTSVEALVERGSNFFVCNNALSGFSYSIADWLGRPATEVYQQLLASIVPGAMAVPAGVMAINAAQEAKFTYIQATL
jgi:intracellular sulfur oxidation DsrE/DsrF family protein